MYFFGALPHAEHAGYRMSRGKRTDNMADDNNVLSFLTTASLAPRATTGTCQSKQTEEPGARASGHKPAYYNKKNPNEVFSGLSAQQIDER